MRTIAVLLLASLAAAQTISVGGGAAVNPPERVAPAVPQAPPVKPEDLCTVEGRVTSATDGAPLKKATVVANLMDFAPAPGSQPPVYSAVTDTSGGYVIRNLEPGKYRVTVTRNGYVRSIYGSRAPDRPGGNVTLSRGQNLKEIDFRLTPHGVVAGRILDEDGEPLVNATVQLMRPQYVQGRRQLAPVGMGQTNDLGEYRVFGLAPGKYYVSVTGRFPMAMLGTAYALPTNAAVEDDYVPTYYPGTADSAAAAAVEVVAGAQVNGISLTLLKARAVHIRGRVVNNAGSRGQIQLMLVPRNAWGMMGNARNNRVAPDGTFDVRTVPGSYTLHATVYGDSKAYAARASVDVGSSDVENLSLVIGHGVNVSGTVRVDGQSKASLSAVNVRLMQREAGVMFQPPALARLKEDNSFVIENAAADLYNVVVTELPEGFYVKSIRAGSLDVQSSGIDLTRGAPEPLQIVVSPNAPTLAGAVQNPDSHQPAPNATVVLVPQQAERRQEALNYRTATTDQAGAYTLTRVAPGEYLAFAFEDLEPGSYMDPDFLKTVEREGESVTLREGEAKSLQLTMIRTDASKVPARSAR